MVGKRQGDPFRRVSHLVRMRNGTMVRRLLSPHDELRIPESDAALPEGVGLQS